MVAQWLKTYLIYFVLMNKSPQVTHHKQDSSITITPADPKFSLVWLHGLGDSSEGFFDFFMDKASPVHIGARVRLLQAPKRPVTINGGNACNSWYDLKVLGGKATTQEDAVSMKEVKESEQTVAKEVEKEAAFWKGHNSNVDPHSLIYVGGFSQGCAISLYYGLQSEKPLAGIIGYSGYLLPSTKLTNLNKTAILINHGKEDPMIPEKLTHEAYERILTSPLVKYEVIPGMPHTVLREQLVPMTKWIQARNKELAEKK